MSDGPERMDKRLSEWRRQLKKWMDEEATSTSFWVVLLVLWSVLLFLVVVSSSLWVMFDDMIRHDAGWIYERLGVTYKTEAIKLLGFTIAGIVAFWGVMAANRRSDAMAKSAEATADSAKATAKSVEAANNTAEAANSTADATAAGNRQRAFKDGVEHLGNDKSSVRQGGAHALFHLAPEDEKLRASIAGVLCAHIRETTGKKDYQEEYKEKPSTEMQSLLRLLFTTETVGEERLAGFWKDITPDLEGGYFRGVELDNARFQEARLRSAQFQGATLDKAQFQKASLDKTQFNDASLTEAQFQGAWLREAQFQEARLRGAQFQGAGLKEAQFQGALLCMAGFQQAKFGKESEHEDNSAQDFIVAKSDELVEKLQASAFHGVSSEPLVLASFEERINDRADKESDFSGVIFSGGVTQELLAEVKEALEQASRLFSDPDFKEKVIRGLESEIGQPESYTPPKEVIAGSYGKEDAERWMREFREAMAKVPETNQAA